jgi:transcriptional regulator with XRE-family HTH domain
MTFGENLKRLREAAELTQAQLAERAGLSLRSLQNWEIDRSKPSLAATLALAQALGVAVEALAAPPRGKGPRRRMGRPPQEDR